MSSFQLPSAGLFHCTDTGLEFGTTGEGDVLYRTVQWEERWLQETGGTPAGPLFDIQSSSVFQLRMPHCAILPGEYWLLQYVILGCFTSK